MATTFAYDPVQNAGQGLLAANQQAFLTGGQSASASAATADVLTFTKAAPGTITVNSTAPFATNIGDVIQQRFPMALNPGGLPIIAVSTANGVAALSYTGTTATTFTGCVYLTGQSGVIPAGGAITNPQTNFYIMAGVASRICGSVYSDQAGTLAILQSFDGYNWDLANNVAVAALTVNGGIDQEVIAPFISFLYSNGPAAQGAFRLHVRLFGNGRQGG